MLMCCDYVCEHVQKITEALYRVTDIFPDKEPLKWYLRDEGLILFKTFMKLRDSSVYERMKYIDKIERAVPHMVHALDLSSSGTFISRKNFEVLCREYGTLLEFVKEKREDFLPASVKELSIAPFKDFPNAFGKITYDEEGNGDSVNSPLNPERKEKILSLIRERGEVSVGDIAAFFTDVGEKTIQRDLIALTRDGVLKKYGDKRWRRYSFVA